MSLPHSRGYASASRVFLAVYLLCVFVPLLIVALWAFTDYWPWPALLPESFSLRGFEEVFNSYSGNGGVLACSVLIACAVSFISVIVALLSARALAFYDFRGKELFRFGTVLPFLIPVTVFAMGIQVAFIRLGWANTVFGVIIAHVVVALPYATVIMCDVTEAAGNRLEEQGLVLGINNAKVLLHITLPQLLPGILSAASMAYILSFSQYFLTLLIGGGTVKTFAVVMFPYLASGDRTIACMYGLVFLAVNFVVFLLFEALLEKFGLRRQESLYQ